MSISLLIPQGSHSFFLPSPTTLCTSDCLPRRSLLLFFPLALTIGVRYRRSLCMMTLREMDAPVHLASFSCILQLLLINEYLEWPSCWHFFSCTIHKNGILLEELLGMLVALVLLGGDGDMRAEIAHCPRHSPSRNISIRLLGCPRFWFGTRDRSKLGISHSLVRQGTALLQCQAHWPRNISAIAA